MKKIIITGSIAYDHLMTFDGVLADSIIPEKIKNLSLSFQSNTHDVHFGGCAANIAYNLKLLGDDPYIFSIAGKDFEYYKEWLKKHKIKHKYIAVDKTDFTAAAYILTDNNQNQLTFFSVGALQNQSKCGDLDFSEKDLKNVSYAIISPGSPYSMLYFAQSCMERNIPYIFDPGQGLPTLSPDTILNILDGSDGVILNRYESDLMSKKLNMTIDRISKRTKFLVQTLGRDGAKLYYAGSEKSFPAITDIKVIDATGCGDAFRSGFIHGLATSESFERACEMGNTAASFVLSSQGTQNHSFTPIGFKKRLNKYYS